MVSEAAVARERELAKLQEGLSAAMQRAAEVERGLAEREAELAKARSDLDTRLAELEVEGQELAAREAKAPIRPAVRVFHPKFHAPKPTTLPVGTPVRFTPEPLARAPVRPAARYVLRNRSISVRVTSGCDIRLTCSRMRSRAFRRRPTRR